MGEQKTQLVISPAEAVNEIRKSQGGFFSVIFTKKNGDERRMTCRLGVKKHLRGSGQPSTVWHIPKYVTVFDVHKKDYRNVNVTALKALRVRGQDYIVA